MTQFRVQLWLDEWYPDPDIDEVVKAATPHQAVAHICVRERIDSASWVRVENVDDKKRVVSYLDVSISLRGRFSCEEAYSS